MKTLEPPSCSDPSLYFIGRNSRGNWVVQDQSGSRGGPVALAQNTIRRPARPGQVRPARPGIRGPDRVPESFAVGSKGARRTRSIIKVKVIGGSWQGRDNPDQIVGRVSLQRVHLNQVRPAVDHVI